MEYPITLDAFKTYFMREAGLEYQPYPTFVKTVYMKDEYVTHNDSTWRSLVDDNIYEPVEGEYWVEVFFPEEEYPEWKQPIAYNGDDKVVAIVNFKPGVWVSLENDNYATPGTDEDKWELDETETENLDSVILDADILRAMGEASFKFNIRLFPKNRQDVIFLYLTMFFLVYDRQAAASGLNGNSAAGPVIHRTVGKMSVTYMESTLYKSNPSYEFLSSNEYGKKAYNLMAPYLRGGVRFFAGANTGD